MNDELKQSNWQEQSIKEMIQKNDEMGEILKHQLDIIEYEKAVDSDLVEFASKYLNGQNKEDNISTYSISKVPHETVEKIKNLVGINLEGFSHVIKPNTIRHIDKRHGENGQQDKSMQNVEDIARVGYILKNHDNIELSQTTLSGYLNKENAPAKIIKYQKRINGNFYIVEALTDTKNCNLQIVSMYKSKAIENEQKKEKHLLDEINSPSFTPEASRASFNNSIPQTPKKVKKKNKNNNKDIER